MTIGLSLTATLKIMIFMKSHIMLCMIFSDFSVQNVLHNRRKIRSRAQNWSVDVFLRPPNDFHEIFFRPIFLKKFGPKIEIFIKITENFDFWSKYFWKSRKT